MAIVAVAEVFKGSWGLVEERRREIESGHHGAFDRIYREEIHRNFHTIDKAAITMDCCVETARKWLKKCDARFIIDGKNHLYLAADIDRAKAHRLAAKTLRQDAA